MSPQRKKKNYIKALLSNALDDLQTSNFNKWFGTTRDSFSYSTGCSTTHLGDHESRIPSWIPGSCEEYPTDVPSIFPVNLPERRILCHPIPVQILYITTSFLSFWPLHLLTSELLSRALRGSTTFAAKPSSRRTLRILSPSQLQARLHDISAGFPWLLLSQTYSSLGREMLALFSFSCS